MARPIWAFRAMSVRATDLTTPCYNSRGESSAGVRRCVTLRADHPHWM